MKHKIIFEIPGLRAEAIQPVGIRITADGKKAYVALGPANRVAVVNTETYEVEKYVLVGQRVRQLAFTPGPEDRSSAPTACPTTSPSSTWPPTSRCSR